MYGCSSKFIITRSMSDLVGIKWTIILLLDGTKRPTDIATTNLMTGHVRKNPQSSLIYPQ